MKFQKEKLQSENRFLRFLKSEDNVRFQNQVDKKISKIFRYCAVKKTANKNYICLDYFIKPKICFKLISNLKKSPSN